MRIFIALALGIFITAPALAQEHPNILTLPSGQSLLHISATERLEVEQDLLIATLRYEAEHANSGMVQDEINRAMKKALELTGDEEGLKVKTLQYSIHKATLPRSKEQTWRGSQGIQMQSIDAEKVLKLSGDLQKMGFITNGLSYSISPERAADIQDGMMEAALDKLQKRADRAAKALGKKTASLIEINVQGGHVPRPVSMYRSAHMEVASMKMMDAAPPVAQAGETTLNLTVSAKAILKP